MRHTRPLRYEEETAAPFWLMTVLAAVMVALVFAAVAVALDDEAGWALFAWYYPLMLVVGVLLVGAFISFRRLRTTVSDETIEFRFGFLRKSLLLMDIQSCEVQKYRWLTYGGWGIRFATQGRRAWSMPGVPEGVQITASEGRRVRRYFVSSRFPELLAEAVRGH